MKNYYKTLRISPTATPEEIKHSFRVLAHQYHPDKNTEQNSSITFVEIKEAYDTLIDPVKRQQYNVNHKQYFGDYYTSYDNIETEKEVKNNSDVEFIFSQLKKFQSSNYRSIVLEEFNDSLINCQSKLNSLKQNNSVKFSSYLDLSSTVARNALEVAEKLLNELLSCCLINPDDDFKKFPLAARYHWVVSWMEDILKYVMSPLENFDMNTATQEIYKLKRLYYIDLKVTFSKKADQKETGKGCYIATMVYGSYNHYNVIILRQFRDNVLEKYFAGRVFIMAYYKISPALVNILKNRSFINRIIRRGLDRWVKHLKGKS
jgi:hypothetical protein